MLGHILNSDSCQQLNNFNIQMEQCFDSQYCFQMIPFDLQSSCFLKVLVIVKENTTT